MHLDPIGKKLFPKNRILFFFGNPTITSALALSSALTRVLNIRRVRVRDVCLAHVLARAKFSPQLCIRPSERLW